MLAKILIRVIDRTPTNRQTTRPTAQLLVFLLLLPSFYLRIKEGREVERHCIERDRQKFCLKEKRWKLTQSTERTRSLRRDKFSSPWPPTRPAPTASRSRSRRICRASSSRRPPRSSCSSTLKKVGNCGRNEKDEEERRASGSGERGTKTADINV